MPGFLHRVAADAQQVVAFVPTRELGHRNVVLDVLLGEDRLAGGDRAEERQPLGADDPADAVDRVPHRPVEQLDRAGLGRVAAQQPDLLEVGEMGMHRGRRGEADSFADVAHGGRIAVLGGVLADEVEDLLLALRQIHVAGGPVAVGL